MLTCRETQQWRRMASKGTMSTVTRAYGAREPIADDEQKRAALGYLQEAWAEARLDGVDGDCMAQACLFAAIAELVTTYGEEAAAIYADGLAGRIRNGEFSIDLARQ
jgi:hypothetical protein